MKVLVLAISKIRKSLVFKITNYKQNNFNLFVFGSSKTLLQLKVFKIYLLEQSSSKIHFISSKVTTFYVM